MTGLRARQKADRRRRIIDTATALFRSVGYDATRLEMIAAESGVSVGTVYNYYENKGDLLVAIVALEVNEVLAAGSRLVAAPPRGTAHAINALMSIYLDHSLIYLSKEMWREAMAITIRQPHTAFSSAYVELDRLLMEQVCDLLLALQSCGEVRRNIDLRSCGELLFNNLNMMFTCYVREDTMTLQALKDQVARQNSVIAGQIAAAPG